MTKILCRHDYFNGSISNSYGSPLGLIKKLVKYIFHSIMLKFINPSAAAYSDKAYKVSICAIFKNEAPYLKEWLDWHIGIGIEHFYLYNNNSDDNYKAVLADYIADKVVTLIDWPVNYRQLDAYEDCIKRYSPDSSWIGFTDIDEYIELREDISSIADVLNKFNTYGSVVLYWRFFGSSGLKERNLSVPVRKAFTSCWSKLVISGKCFFNTAYSFDRTKQTDGSFHHSLWATGRGKSVPPVNVYGHVSFRNFTLVDDDCPTAWINHYALKSLNEFEDRLKKGDALKPNSDKGMDYFYSIDRLCDSDIFKEHDKRLAFLNSK